MNDNEKVDKTRRNLVVATSAVGGAAGVGAAVPFVASMWPSERARAAGAPVEVDLSRIAPDISSAADASRTRTPCARARRSCSRRLRLPASAAGQPAGSHSG